MRELGTAVGAVILALVLQTTLPDRATWHAGWYSVALAALLVLVVVFARRALRSGSPRLAMWTVACGAGVLAVAGIASGLLAPDPQLVIAVPGGSQTLSGLGALSFPALGTGTSPALERDGSTPLPIGTQRYTGSFVLRTIARTVVDVRAYTPSGAQLTVTQPEGSAFSSPVLLMNQRQAISGLELPFDSFAVPAAHRIVRAVLFSSRQVALMRGVTGPPQPMVLFAVDDETDNPLPHAIAMARSGETITIGGLRLRPTIASYPAVDVLSIPSLPAVAVGLAMIAAGAAFAWAAFRTPLRS